MQDFVVRSASSAQRINDVVVSVLRRDPLPGGLVRVALEVPREVRASYTTPGQYVKIRLDEQQALFGLSNDPGNAVWELIFRPVGDVASNLASTHASASTTSSLRITRALGAGFPLETVKGQPLVIAVAGSGIAAGRTLVRARLASGDATNTRLYLGVRTRFDIPLIAEIESWLQRGCRVLACLSRDSSTTSGYWDDTKLRLAPGYVQDSLAKDLVTVPAARIFAVGSRPMVESLRMLARDLSMTDSDVVTNH